MGNIQFDFSGKRVLVTGGGQGIGRKIVESFFFAKAEVLVWEKSPKCIKRLKQDFPSVSVQQVDVSQKESCFHATRGLPAPIDFLINNAGILKDRSLSKMTWEEYSSVMGTNLNGVFLSTKYLLPHFTTGSFKRIVNLSSISALYGFFGQSNYSASKAGVLALTKVWARELGRKGWTVNALVPGLIQTDILKDMPEDLIKNLIEKIPTSRIGQVEDVSSACLFLCSEEAGYINGALLEVTGGLIV